MTEFYIYLSSRDSSDIRKNNTPSEFWIQFPKSYLLEGQWKCALIEISLTCNFKPRSPRLYLCCDILEESYVRDTSLQILKNIEVGGRYNKVKSESYLRPLYVPVKVTTLDRLRLVLKD